MRLRAWQLDDADDPIGLPLDIPITAVPCVVGRKTSRSEGADVSHFVDMDLSGRPLTNSHVRTPTRHVHVCTCTCVRECVHARGRAGANRHPLQVVQPKALSNRVRAGATDVRAAAALQERRRAERLQTRRGGRRPAAADVHNSVRQPGVLRGVSGSCARPASCSAGASACPLKNANNPKKCTADYCGRHKWSFRWLRVEGGMWNVEGGGWRVVEARGGGALKTFVMNRWLMASPWRGRKKKKSAAVR